MEVRFLTKVQKIVSRASHCPWTYLVAHLRKRVDKWGTDRVAYLLSMLLPFRKSSYSRHSCTLLEFLCACAGNERSFVLGGMDLLQLLVSIGVCLEVGSDMTFSVSGDGDTQPPLVCWEPGSRLHSGRPCNPSPWWRNPLFHAALQNKTCADTLLAAGACPYVIPLSFPLANQALHNRQWLAWHAKRSRRQWVIVCTH